LKGATALTGAAATEGAVKALRGPRILHIATHGFFFPELHSGAANPCSRTRASAVPAGHPSPPPPGGRAAEIVVLDSEAAPRHPLLQSGLAFAGANEPQDDEDGVLTALEASSLDLWGTKLVVLSACETGMGEVRNGQGVHGLRRALALAGAETQVMSLWKVDDEATRDLMVGYYQGLGRGRGRAEAMREVQLAMKANAATAHPYFWAGFIVSGNDAPLPLADRAELAAPPKVGPTSRGCGCELAGYEGPRAGLWPLLLATLAVRRHNRRRRSARGSGPTTCRRR